MEARICRVTFETSTGNVNGVILEGQNEIARIQWFLAGLYGRDPVLAMDMIRARFLEWARVYKTTNVEVITI